MQEPRTLIAGDLKLVAVTALSVDVGGHPAILNTQYTFSAGLRLYVFNKILYNGKLDY